MATTYSSNLRVAKQERPDNQNTWGDVLRDNTVQMLEEAITSLQSISVAAGNVTLSTNNGLTDQSRAMGLKLTGSPGTTRTITAPAVTKHYIVWNASDSTVEIEVSGGTAASIPSGERVWVFSDGTDFYRVGVSTETAETINGLWTLANGVNIGNADTTLTRASAGDINVEGNIIYRAGGTDVPVADGGTGASTATAALNNLLPSQSGNSGKVLQTNGTNASWETSTGVTDHGALTGLSDDDHTQYVLVAGTRSMTGNLTISKATPTLTLTDSGGSNFSVRAESSTLVIKDVNGADDIFNLAQTGNLTIDGTFAWSASDPRLKTRFRDFDSGEIIDALHVGQFDWDADKCEAAGFRAHDDQAHYGFDAQSILAAMGEVAAPLAPFDRDEEGKSKSGNEYRTKNDSEILGVVVKELQKLRARVAELEGR
jgi:hypothetical protein